MEKIGGSFGFKKSTVSSAWKNATKRQLEELMNRDLAEMKIVAVFIDGKRFRTEGVLFVVDGGSGLNKALEERYSVQDPRQRLAVRVRCYVHKWANIEDALGKDSPATEEASRHYWNMRQAEDLMEALAHTRAREAVLRKANLSALASFQEAKDDLLIIHKLGLSATLKRAFSTTNAAESLNSMLEEDTRRVKRWRDSEHFQRWLATAALKNEKRMYRVRGFVGLPALAIKLKRLCAHSQLDEITEAA